MKSVTKNLTSEKKLNIIIPIILVIITLPLISRAFTSRNEYRYVEIARSILKNGNPFVYYVDNVLYTDKPPLYFWIMIISRFLFGNYYTYGIVLFNIAIEAFMLIKLNNFLSKKFGQKDSIIMLFLIATSILQYISLILVRMDIFLSSFITITLIEFFECYEMENYRNIYKVYIYTGIAFLFKGPVGVLTPFLVIIIFKFFSRKKYTLRDIKFLKGIGVVLLFILFWIGPAYMTMGIPFLENLFIKQVFARTVSGFVHKQPFYYYIMLFPFIFFPWSIMVIYGTYRYIKDFMEKQKISDLEVFLIIWSLITLFYLSLSSSKLVIYLLPIITPVMILAFIKISKANNSVRNRIYYLTLSFFLCACLSIPFVNGKDFAPYRYITAMSFVATILFSVLLFIKGYRNLSYYSFGMVIIFITIAAGINMSFINIQIRKGKKATYSLIKNFHGMKKYSFLPIEGGIRYV